MSERLYVSETIGEFRARGGAITANDVSRFTSDSVKSPTMRRKLSRDELKTTLGRGHLMQIGSVTITKKTSRNNIDKLILESSDDCKMVEVYPTRFCTNCERSSWQFVEFERRGHSTCRGCGTVQKSKKSHMGTLYLNDEGKGTKSMWECTPGMDQHDSRLVDGRGKRMDIGPQRPKSHLRNYWRILKKIDGIGGFWHFIAIEGLIRSAKAKMKSFYHSIHDGITSDTHRKLPHGGAALAAACFYCAVLEFEERVKYKTPCTLPAIQEGAASEVDRKNHRSTRDVTDLIILKYAQMLKKRGLCSVFVPQIGAETLKFTATSASLEHARMALFNECRPVKFYLPVSESWGMQVGDTHQGVLYINSVQSDGVAFDKGLRNGDYIFQLQGKTMGIETSPSVFLRQVIAAKQKEHQLQIEVCIMRKKKP
tara:strand:+ start:1925 stop:3199 length:1275 start_codon:yes stop_codon:yes gene_type:complete